MTEGYLLDADGVRQLDQMARHFRGTPQSETGSTARRRMTPPFHLVEGVLQGPLGFAIDAQTGPGDYLTQFETAQMKLLVRDSAISQMANVLNESQEVTVTNRDPYFGAETGDIIQCQPINGELRPIRQITRLMFRTGIPASFGSYPARSDNPTVYPIQSTGMLAFPETVGFQTLQNAGPPDPPQFSTFGYYNGPYLTTATLLFADRFLGRWWITSVLDQRYLEPAFVGITAADAIVTFIAGGEIENVSVSVYRLTASISNLSYFKETDPFSGTPLPPVIVGMTNDLNGYRLPKGATVVCVYDSGSNRHVIAAAWNPSASMPAQFDGNGDLMDSTLPKNFPVIL